MSTPLDIIKAARKLLNLEGTGETPCSEDSAEGFTMLNDLIDNWNLQGWIHYYTLTETFTMTANQYIYAIGPGQSFNTTLPVKITNVVTRLTAQSIPIDYPCMLIESEQYWRDIVNKLATTYYPQYCLFTRTYPYGELRFFPVPTQPLTCVLSQWKQISRFITHSETITLPPGYELALKFNLAVLIAPMNGRAVNKGDFVYDEAERLLATIKRVNQRTVYLQPESFMIQKGRYSIYSDSTR